MYETCKYEMDDRCDDEVVSITRQHVHDNSPRCQEGVWVAGPSLTTRRALLPHIKLQRDELRRAEMWTADSRIGRTVLRCEAHERSVNEAVRQPGVCGRAGMAGSKY